VVVRQGRTEARSTRQRQATGAVSVCISSSSDSSSSSSSTKDRVNACVCVCNPMAKINVKPIQEVKQLRNQLHCDNDIARAHSCLCIHFASAPCGLAPTAPSASIASTSAALRRKRSVSEFSLCLSRACLSKMFVFIYKWLKRTVFLPETNLSQDVYCVLS
jgi:hypothetical protein